MRLTTSMKRLVEGSTIQAGPDRSLLKGPLTPTPASDQTAKDNNRTTAWQPQPSPSNTQAGVPQKEMIDAMQTLQGLRADHLANMSLDQKLALVLQKSTDAEKVSYQALRGISDFNYRLDRVFKDLSAMIERVAQGKPSQEPGQSIFDEDDPESILGY
jgi:hypothetical protein